MRAPRKSAPAVKNGRVQKKNNWDLSASLWNHDLPFPVLVRERPSAGFRHLLLQRDIEKFIGLLPEWAEMSRGLSSIVLARGEDDGDLMGWHSPGVVAICAWEVKLRSDYVSSFFVEHRAIIEKLNVPWERKSEGDREWFECHWTEETARAFQLLHILLHELGHHHDRMTTRSKKRAARGESFAEAYAQKHEALIWDRYTRAFKL